jgi:cold shock CspA family protein
MKHSSRPGQPLPERGRPRTGGVLRIARGQGQGYIRVTGDGRNVFFDRRDLIDVGFNDLSVGDSVAFELIDDRFSGPRAVLVRRCDGEKRSTE